MRGLFNAGCRYIYRFDATKSCHVFMLKFLSLGLYLKEKVRKRWGRNLFSHTRGNLKIPGDKIAPAMNRDLLNV